MYHLQLSYAEIGQNRTQSNLQRGTNLQKQGSAHHWKLSKVHTGPRYAHSFQPSACVQLCKKNMPGVIQNHENKYVRGIGQGEARHRKYKRLKLGGGQTCDRSIPILSSEMTLHKDYYRKCSVRK
jgi:hypothetical protein